MEGVQNSVSADDHRRLLKGSFHLQAADRGEESLLSALHHEADIPVNAALCGNLGATASKFSVVAIC